MNAVMNIWSTASAGRSEGLRFLWVRELSIPTDLTTAYTLPEKIFNSLFPASSNKLTGMSMEHLEGSYQFKNTSSHTIGRV